MSGKNTIMSRIGKLPIYLPPEVSIKIHSQTVEIEGPRGKLHKSFPQQIYVQQRGNYLSVIPKGESKKAYQMYGLSRTLLQNMVSGVINGFERRLEIVGLGYRGYMDDSRLILNLGYSHPVHLDTPKEVELKVQNNSEIIISGIDKEAVGKVAARIKSLRPPEPYKGKGIRYKGEKILLKEGKAGKK